MVEEESHKEISLRSLTELQGRQKYIFSSLSFIFVVILTILFYLVPDYYFLEEATVNIVFHLLKIYQFDVVYDGYWIDNAQGESIIIVKLTEILTFLDTHDAKAPVIKSELFSRRFAVVRSCTAMQAGALLFALIIVTPAKPENKVKATFYVLIAVLVGNFLRIALIIGFNIIVMSNYGLDASSAWLWGHDVLGKPIGFFGTMYFAFLIEKQDVPVLNTVSLWLDSILDIFSPKSVKK